MATNPLLTAEVETIHRPASRPGLARLLVSVAAGFLAFASLTLIAAAAWLAKQSFVDASHIPWHPGHSSAAIPAGALIPALPPSYVLHEGSLLGRVSLSGSADALSALAAPVYKADSLWPGSGVPLSRGSSLWLQRSVPFVLLAGGERIQLRGKGVTVGEALASAGIYLLGADYSDPAPDTPLQPFMTVSLSRVQERVEIEQRTTSYQTVWQPDPDLELDQTRVVRQGQEGIDLQRYKVVLINGKPVSRELQDQWTKQQPMDQQMAYGTKVIVRQLQTADGPIEYWRILHVLVTSYSASTAGQAPSSPHYGFTRTGKQAQTGIVAVDPGVIALGTRLYVPGYGFGLAEDTGGGILGKHIDVCYNDKDLVPWYRWVDIYLLTPVPPEGAIRYVLPNWPRP